MVKTKKIKINKARKVKCKETGKEWFQINFKNLNKEQIKKMRAVLCEIGDALFVEFTTPKEEVSEKTEEPDLQPE